VASWLLGFAVVWALAADSSGYWPTAWGWSSLVLLLVASLALLAKSTFAFGVREGCLLSGLVGFGIWSALSALWSPSWTQPLLSTERTTVYIAGVSACLLVGRSSTPRSLLSGVLFAVTLICSYSLLTRLLPTRLGSFDSIANYRLEAPLGYWNALGIFAVIGLLLAVGFLIDGALIGRSLAAAAIVVLVSVLYFTYSRGAWAAFIAGALVMLLLAPKRLRLAVWLLAAAPWPAIAVWRASRSRALTHVGTGAGAAAHDGARYALLVIVLAVGAAVAAAALTFVESVVKPTLIVRRLFGALLLVLAGGDRRGNASRRFANVRRPPELAKLRWSDRPPPRWKPQ
jgi:hypothetical protein